jgi:hypothetical protein
MSKCVRCGAETRLYLNGVPICPECDEKPKPAAPVPTKMPPVQKNLEIASKQQAGESISERIGGFLATRLPIMITKESIPKLPCSERLRLSDGVATAVKMLYAAKTEYTQAVKQKIDAEPFAAALTEARRAERFAVSALDKHRKEHDCGLG